MKLGEFVSDAFTKIKEKFAGTDYIEENGMTDDMTDYDYPDYEQDYKEVARPKTGFANSSASSMNDSGYSTKTSGFTYLQKVYDKKTKSPESRIIIFTPETANNTAEAMADAIKDGNIVVLNLVDSPIPAEKSQRMCDYLIGVCYAVGAEWKIVTQNIIIMTPSSCRVSESEKDSIARTSARYAQAVGFGR